MKILIVEDDFVIAESLASELKMELRCYCR